MRNIDTLYQELQDVNKELEHLASKHSTIAYKDEWNRLCRRKHNICININQIKNMIITS